MLIAQRVPPRPRCPYHVEDCDKGIIITFFILAGLIYIGDSGFLSGVCEPLPESTRIHLNPTLHLIRPNPKTTSH